MEKRVRSGRNILYLLQDMREFELYGTVAAVVSICDSMNYILEYGDLVQVFKLVNNYLDRSSPLQGCPWSWRPGPCGAEAARPWWEFGCARRYLTGSAR